VSYQARFSLAIAFSIAAHASSLVWGNFPLLLESPSRAIVLQARLLPGEKPAPPVPVARPLSELPGEAPAPLPPPQERPASPPAPEQQAALPAPDAQLATLNRSVEAPPARSSIRVLESIDFDLLLNRPIDITRGRVYSAYEVSRRAAALDDIDPQYPLAALAAGLDGTVVLMLVIDENGKVAEQATLVADPPIFEAYAVETIRHVRWVAAELGPAAVKSLLLLEFRYRVER
jgi:outer membrane biosynthesis protein TonB